MTGVELLHDWRFLVFMATLLFNIGMAWSQYKSTRRDIESIKNDIADLKRRVLNGITTTLQLHGQTLAAIEARCEARMGDRRDRRSTD